MGRSVSACDLLGLADIAPLIGLSYSRVRHLHSDGTMPMPDHIVGGTPIWERCTIEGWAVETGRMPATTKEER